VTAAPSGTRRGEPRTGTTIRILFGATVKAVTQRTPAPAPAKKSRKRRDEDKGRATWRNPFERRFLKAIHARGAAKVRAGRAAFKNGMAIMVASPSIPPPDRDSPLAVDMADTLDWLNPFETPEAFTAEIDAGYAPPQSFDFPQP
jgi:hypothetical protein